MAESRRKPQVELIKELKRKELLPESGFAFSEEERLKIIEKLKNEPNGLYEKKRTGKKSKKESKEKITIQDILNQSNANLHPVVKTDSGYYAILGNLGEGSYGKVKYAQNIETGEIRLFKMQSVHNQVKSQYSTRITEDTKKHALGDIKQKEEEMRAYVEFEHQANQALAQGFDAIIERKRPNKEDFGIDNLPEDTVFITMMEYLPGESLLDVIDNKNPISREDYFNIILGAVYNSHR